MWSTSTEILKVKIQKHNDALELWFDSPECEVAPENEIQKNWTEPIFERNFFKYFETRTF